jgi:histidinol-phosphate/aromatic aminotransferase/cobyric acid decarboxylase-like protein/choline kinase
MKALILAAGFGNRMRPLTDNLHKTLLKVSGRSIIERIVAGLLDNGISHIVVVTGYRADELTDYLLSTFPNVKFEFVNNPKYRVTNNIYSMALAFESINFNDDILLIESDLLYEPDVIERAIKSTYNNVALVSPYRTGLDGTVVEVNQGRITAIYPTHLQDANFNLFDKYKTLNIYKFSKSFCENEFKKLLVYYAKTIDDNCYYELILGILIYMAREIIYCEIIDKSKWAEVDDPNDLKGAEFQFNKRARLGLLKDGFGGYWNYDVVDFCFIRNMYFPTRSVLSEMKNNLPSLIQNYGSRQLILNEKLSYVMECNKKHLIALNGASQAYPILSRFFKGKKILLPNVTFGEYPRWFTAHETYDDLDGVSKSEVEKKLENCDLAIFVNPNQPSGTTVDSHWILTLADSHKETTFLVDESFIDFSDQTSLVSLLDCVPRANVFILRSMSKSHGVPGVRLGFLYTSNVELFDFVMSDIPVWNMNSVAEFYLEILLKNKNALLKSFAQTKLDRTMFSMQLADLKVFEYIYPSGGNYLLARGSVKHFENGRLDEYLLSEHSIFVKDVSDKIADLSNKYFRFAVRTPDENGVLIAAIRDYQLMQTN